jgi:hypothetical protein
VGTFVEAGKQYAYLADGSSRMVGKPKKKKYTHIQPSKTVVPYDNKGDEGAQNAYLRKALNDVSGEW